MLKFAQFKMALLVNCAMLTVVPLKVSPTDPYCTNDCADVPQLLAVQGVGTCGGAAVAIAAYSAINPAADTAKAEPGIPRSRFALFDAIAPFKNRGHDAPSILSRASRIFRDGYVTSESRGAQEEGPVLPRGPPKFLHDPVGPRPRCAAVQFS